MRDGINLNATIFMPKEMEKPLPVIFTLTPYIADGSTDRGMYFAKNGYAYAMVDTRGRGNSQGDFIPLLNEPKDGHDITQWLGSQSWCDGQVTMWGGSYAGYDQWATLKEFPAALKTVVPVASAHPGIDFPSTINILYPYEMQWLSLVSGVTGNSKLFATPEFWIEKFTELQREHLPFTELEKLVGNFNPNFRLFTEHYRIDDPLLLSMVPSPEDYGRVNIPILTITGHYDGDQPGAMHYYRQHMKYGTPEAKAKHYLIVGPWDHAGTRTPIKEFGGMTFGEASLLDMNNLHKEWYDWTMKDGSKPEFLKKNVAYYVCGAEEWKYVDNLEEISNETMALYLGSPDGKANDVFRSGSLTPQKAFQSAGDSYVYDPLDTRLADLEQEDIAKPYLDQRYALNLFGNGLVYHTDAFSEDTEITGWASLKAWISMDVPDTDFQATLYEILADGTSILLTETMQRARYRNGLDTETLAKTGEINLYEFDYFTFFSRRIAKHSRLRLVFRCPSSIFSERNYNSGGKVAEESGKDARTAHITLYHDAQHPSCLELPVVRR